ncbi:oligogalacturonate lyase family protein [Dysgonomonas macrotermitis]|uniref:Oligogalacturonide lyase n=1 Tax=Dysgonomonas macrotermitis TaxID=1346286 RepID=A0A1M4TLN1_9BACT|nr:oligogalacturonate lyase family protein [Dysgonomonas macrotermitis]SHE45315.1 oligogalacturonide lyase [Dysgonomonas macrotermitis]
MKFIKQLLITGILSGAAISSTAGEMGRLFPSEKYVMIDHITGNPITVLTSAKTSDAKLYQTHPQWTSDGRFIVFRSSDRATDKTSQAFAVNESTGDIIQLTDGEGTGTGSLNVARLSNKLYYFRNSNKKKTLIELNLDSLINDSYRQSVKDKTAYERIITTLPDDLAESGGFTLDADETKAYVGVRRIGVEPTEPHNDNFRIQQVPSGIRSIDLVTGEIAKVVDVSFTMGHLQANPFVPGEILYCQETGGDAPQRMWMVNADGSGNRPLYVENPDDWVTHEAWVDKDHVYFNVMGHLDRLRTKATGLFSINVRTNKVDILGQLDYGSGFWHCGGTSDGKWAASDNFEGEVYLINCHTGQRTLLTADHKMKPDHTHPSFSPDNTRVLIQSGQVSDGKKLDLMVVNIPSYLKF